jgi:F-type H+-transporting ATPase subunit b
MSKKMIRILLAVIFVIGVCITAYAAEGGGDHHGGFWAEWGWKIINFAILIFILVKFLAKPMKNYFKKRTELIEKSLTEAAEAKEIAMKALKEVEDKLRLKDQEIERIIESARQSGEAERDRLIEHGREMSEKIRQQAKTNIELELKNAKRELRAEAAEISIRMAEEKLKKRLSEEDQLKLIDESIRKLEE